MSTVLPEARVTLALTGLYVSTEGDLDSRTIGVYGYIGGSVEELGTATISSSAATVTVDLRGHAGEEFRTELFVDRSGANPVPLKWDTVNGNAVGKYHHWIEVKDLFSIPVS